MARVVLALTLMLTAQSAFAYSAGVDTQDCNSCHNSGSPPAVTITFDPPTAAAGDVLTVTIAIQAINGDEAGINFSADVNTDGTSKGAFTLTDTQYTRKGSISNSFLHAQPKPKDSDNYVRFTAKWQAPVTAGTATFTAAAVSANGNGSSSGDGFKRVTAQLTFGCDGKPFYTDSDGDGYGATNSSVTTLCALQTGYSATKDDCNDNDENIHPGAKELCNGRDDDCNNQTDDGLTNVTLYPDSDHDGYGVAGTPRVGCNGAGYGEGTADCNDNDRYTYPGAPESCDGYDNDCDGSVDEGVRPTCGIGQCRRTSLSCSASLPDCTPGKATAEVCNGLDDDCDGTADEDGPTCSNGGQCEAGVCAGGASVDDEDDSSPGETSDSQSNVSGCASAPFGALALTLAFSFIRRRYSLKRR